MVDIEKITKSVSSGQMTVDDAIYIISSFLEENEKTFDLSIIANNQHLLQQALTTSIDFFYERIEEQKTKDLGGKLLHTLTDIESGQVLKTYYY